MGASETAEFLIVVDAKRANATIDETRGRVASLGGGLGDLRKGADELDKGFAKLRGATSGLSDVAGGMSRSISQAYGAASDLADAFAAGGGLMLGVVAASQAVALLNEHFAKLNAELDQAEKALFATLKPLAAARDETIKTATEGVRQLQLEYANLFATVEQAEFNKIAFQVADLQTQIISRYGELKSASGDRAETLRGEIALLNQQVNALNDAATASGKLRREIDAENKRRAPKKQDTLSRTELDALSSMYRDMIQEDREYAAAKAALEADDLARQAQHQEALTRIHDEGVQRRMAAEEAAMAEQEAAQARFAAMTRDVYVDQAGAAFSTSIGIFQDYLDAKINGAENAEALVAAAFLRGVGQQLVGVGIKQGFEGAGLLAASGGTDPRGWTLAGLGAAAIATGVAMGAGGTAIAASARPASAPSNAAARRQAGADPGVNRRASAPSRRDDDPGAGVTVVINYNGVGPSAAETARQVRRVIETGRRRGVSL